MVVAAIFYLVALAALIGAAIQGRGSVRGRWVLVDIFTLFASGSVLAVAAL